MYMYIYMQVQAYKNRKAARKKADALAKEEAANDALTEEAANDALGAGTSADTDALGAGTSADTDALGAGTSSTSEYDHTIDACLAVTMGPNKTAAYLEDLWMRAGVCVCISRQNKNRSMRAIRHDGPQQDRRLPRRLLDARRSVYICVSPAKTTIRSIHTRR